MKFLNIITALCVTLTVAIPTGGLGGKGPDTALEIKGSKIVKGDANAGNIQPGMQPIIQSGYQAYSNARNNKQSITQAFGKGFQASKDAYQVNQYLDMHTKADNLEANAAKIPTGAARDKMLNQAKGIRTAADKYGFQVTQGNPGIQTKLINAYPNSGGARMGQPANVDTKPAAQLT